MSAADAAMVRLTIDGQEVEARPGELLIKAAEDSGTYIPRFCWHPRMNPVGMCRMCLVEIETPRGRLMVPSCMQPVSDGMVAHTESEAARKAQEGVLEFLLLNHPLDCPVCDKGGECPLQDQTMTYGPGESRFVEEKRHFAKPIPISDLVLLDRERCILCARCTRFSDEISGDPLIEFHHRGDDTQVLTFPDERFSSYFSGNTVQICPVGALTATPYRFRARPWDLHTAESTGMIHTEGSRVAVHASHNRVLRLLGVDNGAVNQGWLSDKERFAFEFIGSPDRLRTPLIREGTGFREAGWGEALDRAAQRLRSVISERGGGAVAALGGARGTNEDAYALSKFMRTAAGSNNLDARMGDGLDARFLAGLAGRGRIDDLESARSILLWGPDLKETHPILYLRVRRAAQELGAELVVIHPRATGLDDRAAHKFTYRPGTGPEILERPPGGGGRDGRRPGGPGRRSAGGPGRPAGPGRGRPPGRIGGRLRPRPGGFHPPAGAPGQHLRRSGHGGGARPAPRTRSIRPRRRCARFRGRLGGAAVRARSRRPGDRRGGRVGRDRGVDPVRRRPGAGPGGRRRRGPPWTGPVSLSPSICSSPTRRGGPTSSSRRWASPRRRARSPIWRGGCRWSTGWYPARARARADRSILDDLAARMDRPIGLASGRAVADEIARTAPAYAGVTWEYLEWDAPEGAVVPLEGAVQPLVHEPRPHDIGREVGAYTLHLARTMFDDGVLMRHSPSLARLAPGAAAYLTPADAAARRLHEGERIEIGIGNRSFSLPVRLDPSLSDGTVYVPFNQPGMFESVVEGAAGGSA